MVWCAHFQPASPNPEVDIFWRYPDFTVRFSSETAELPKAKKYQQLAAARIEGAPLNLIASGTKLRGTNA